MLKKFRRLVQRLGFQKKIHYPRQVATIQDQHYVIRQLETEDIKELLDIERIVYAGEIPWTKSAFLSELVSPFKHLYLAVEKETVIIAFIGCRIAGDDGHITNIAVLPKYQQRGIGGYLLEVMEEFARQQNCRTMSLEVRISNKDAQRLYRKAGFVSRAVKRQYYDSTNEDAIDMVKFLEN